MPGRLKKISFATLIFAVLSGSFAADIEFVRPDNTPKEKEQLAAMWEELSPKKKETGDFPKAMLKLLDKRLDLVTYTIFKKTMKNIKKNIKKLFEKSNRQKKDEIKKFYMPSVGKQMWWPKLFNGWIPVLPEADVSLKKLKNKRYYEWQYVNGRLSQIDLVIGKRRSPIPCYKVWYNSQHAPILCVRYRGRKKVQSFTYGEYDSGGLLKRLTSFSKRMNFKRCSILVNASGYRTSERYTFEGFAGKKEISSATYAYKGFQYSREFIPTPVNGYLCAKKAIFNSGPAGNYLKELTRLKEYGLKSIYPIPGDEKLETTKK